MTDTFRTRIPTLSDDELRHYVAHPLEYRIEAVEMAVRELSRRGYPVSAETWTAIRTNLEQRDAAMPPDPNPWCGGLLGKTPASRKSRVRLITGTILSVGLGAATILYLNAQAKATNPLGYEPLDTKKHLRDLELYGGKANVLATELRGWLDGLWHGRPLAFTVAGLTLLLAVAFWFIATRHLQDLDTPLE